MKGAGRVTAHEAREMALGGLVILLMGVGALLLALAQPWLD